MKDIKMINRRFLLTITLFVIYLAVVVSIIWYSYLHFPNSNVLYAVTFMLLLVTLFVTSIFRARLDSVTNTSYLIKIRKNAGDPLPIKRIKTKEFLHTYLVSNNYIMFSKQSNYFLYYRAKKDHIKKMLRGYILEIVVYIDASEKEFYLEVIDEQIQKIQDLLRKEKKKVEKLLITQIKVIDALDHKTKQRIKEIVFIRSQTGIISTINIGLHYESNQAVLLYSDTYSPSLYYNYHIEEIKKMI